MRLTRAELNIVDTLAGIGRAEEAMALARASLDTARSAGLARTLGTFLRSSLARLLLLRGDWDEADRVAAAALDDDPVGGPGALLHVLRGRIALLRGETETARERLSLARALVGDDPGMPLVAVSLALLAAEIALRENRLEEAREAVSAALPYARGAPFLGWPLLVTAAQAEARLRARARALGEPVEEAGAGRILQIAGQLPVSAPLSAAYAAWVAAELAPPGAPGDGSRDGSAGGSDGGSADGPGDGPGDAAAGAGPVARWERAAEAWAAIGDPYAEGYARMRAAEAAAVAHDRSRAAELLRVAAERAEPLRAGPLLDEIRMIGRRLGVALPGPAEAAPASRDDTLARLGLTEREVEILRLVTAGRTNPQIAASLFISAKTVSAHVSHILAKLGVATRGEAAALAHRLGLFDDAELESPGTG